MTKRRFTFAFAVLLVAVLHFAVSYVVAFNAGISGGFARVLSHILLFPLGLFSGPESLVWGWVLWALVSLLWGLGICTLLGALRRGRKKV